MAADLRRAIRRGADEAPSGPELGWVPVTGLPWIFRRGAGGAPSRLVFGWVLVTGLPLVLRRGAGIAPMGPEF